VDARRELEIPQRQVAAISAVRSAGRASVAVRQNRRSRAGLGRFATSEQSGDGSLLMAGRTRKRELSLRGLPNFAWLTRCYEFHMPRSTLLALVCAFAGSRTRSRSVSHAVAHQPPRQITVFTVTVTGCWIRLKAEFLREL